jgi:lysophospholipase L1-like esterase
MTADRPFGACSLAGCLLAVALVGCGAGAGASTAGNSGPSPSAAGSPGPSSSAAATATLGSWSYVAFGDSLAFGEGDAHGVSFVRDLAHLIEQQRPVKVSIQNLAFDGGTSATLLDALQHDPKFQQALAQANLVTIEIGANDIDSGLQDYAARSCGGVDNLDCFRAGVAAFKGNWDAILAAVVKARSPKVAAIRVLSDYDNFVGNSRAAANLGPTIARDIAPFLDQVNDDRCSKAMSAGITCIDIARVLNGPSRHGVIAADLMGSDGIHPSAAGHLLIAQTIDAAGYAPLP